MDESHFKEKLTPEQYRVMREKGTETAFAGKHWDNEDHGLYVCAACDNPLFTSVHQFDAGTGWPTFRKPLRTKHIELHKDEQGQEVRCARCKSHLGYLVGDHYQLNSVAMHFLDMGDIDLEALEGDDAQAKDQQKSSTAKTITLTIGGLAIGFAAGAAATPAPVPVCTPTPLIQTATPTATPLPTPRATPQATPVVTPAVTPTLAPSPTPTPDPGSAGTP